MRIQLLSDLHLESESFTPTPAPEADVLVLAGDIDTTWRRLADFAGWPVPVLFVAGNHEYERRDLPAARAELAAHCAQLGFIFLEQAVWIRQGVRFVGTTRWSDFDVFGQAQRPRALRAGAYFQKVMQATVDGQPFDAPAVREEALRCRAWLAGELARSGDWRATVVVTHFAPSLRSADPRYGNQPTTASFCNADDDLLDAADLWLHGHVHVRHDYRVGRCRVVAHPRGLARKGEAEGYRPWCVLEV